MSGATARSPFAGCAVIIAVLAVMLFLLGFSVWSLFKLDSEIAKFTSETARPTPVAALDGREADLNALMARLEVFRGDLAADPPRPAELALAPADLNHAIAACDEFRELRGTFHVAAVDDRGRLRIDVAFPMNPRPFSGRERHLNATLVARPELHPGEAVLAIEEIEVPGAVVPDEFRGHLSPYRLLERYRDHPQLGAAMRRLTSVAVENGAVVLRAVPGEEPPHSTPAAAAGAASSRVLRLLGLIACLFLVAAGAVVFLGLRRAEAAKGSDETQRS